MTHILRAAHLVALVAAGLLFATVALSVAARALFDLTGGAVNLLIPGAIEISTYALMVMVFAALPGAAVVGLVRVDILIHRLPDRMADLLERAWGAVTAGFGLILVWLLAEESWLQAGRGDVTQDLELPLWPLSAVAALGAAVLALAMIERVVLTSGAK